MVCLSTGKSSRTRSTSNPTVILLLAVLMEFLEKSLFQAFPQRWYLYAVDDVLRKRVSQQVTSLRFADAARLQIEQGLGIQLTDGCAVSTADIVGQNL